MTEPYDITSPPRPVNAVTCRTCGTRIESRHRHDFQVCACGENSPTFIAVDGGPVYARRVYGPQATWQEADGTVYPTPRCLGCGRTGVEHATGHISACGLFQPQEGTV